MSVATPAGMTATRVSPELVSFGMPTLISAESLIDYAHGCDFFSQAAIVDATSGLMVFCLQLRVLLHLAGRGRDEEVVDAGEVHDLHRSRVLLPRPREVARASRRGAAAPARRDRPG